MISFITLNVVFCEEGLHSFIKSVELPQGRIKLNLIFTLNNVPEDYLLV